MGESGLGFGAEVKSKQQMESEITSRKVIHHDLVKFGLIPELVGRLPVIASLDAMDEETLYKIMVEPKNSVIKQYVELFKMDNIELEFEDEALKFIAKETVERKTGARGLRSIIENILRDIMYNAPSDKTISKIIITKECAEGKDSPRVENKNGRKTANKTSESDTPVA
jgi:ATP-dependent Clp protease ATP-binding subunit ClpX